MAMKTLLQEIQDVGMSKDQALQSVAVIQKFLNEYYPILGTLAASTIFKDILEEIDNRISKN